MAKSHKTEISLFSYNIPQTFMQELSLNDFSDIIEKIDANVISAIEVCENHRTYFPGSNLFDDENLNKYTGKNLPHWELAGTIYHVCFRLADSVPITQQNIWLAERENFRELCLKDHRQLTPYEQQRLQFLFSDKVEQYLDSGYGACVLKEPNVAETLKKTLEFFNNQRYLLHAWCIMPNHVHTIFQILADHTLANIIQNWKSYSAHSINKMLGRHGSLWQADNYNHIIRSEAEYFQQVRYVWHNPDKAHFANWPWRWMCLNEQEFNEKIK